MDARSNKIALIVANRAAIIEFTNIIIPFQKVDLVAAPVASFLPTRNY